MGSSLLEQRLNPGPRQRKLRVLTTELIRNFLYFYMLYFFFFLVWDYSLPKKKKKEEEKEVGRGGNEER